MNLFVSMKAFHHDFTKVHLKRRAVPLAALVLTTSMTCTVIAAGLNVYEITDGTTTERVSLYQEGAETALANSSFGDEDYSIVSVVSTENDTYDVIIKQKYDVTIVVDGETVTYHTADIKVSNLLAEADIALGDEDIVSPSLDTTITEPTQITITRVTKAQKTQTQSIAYTSETRNTDELYTGESRVAQKGINGVQQNTLEYTYHDGVQVSCVQLRADVVTAPVNEIVETGTKQREVVATTQTETTSQTETTTQTATTSQSTSVNYSKVITVEATAYSGGGLTASGTSARVGAIAVDPSVIPLGSKLYITSADGTSWVYGYAVAEDTGGAIKGNRIDLYFNTEAQCNNFGRQSAKVYVLS